MTESVLKSLGWEIDESDRAVGWFLTDSRGVDFKDYAVYGKGLRHKLRIALKAAGEGRTTVSVERELYTEERILWMTERKPVVATDQTVENAVLDAIGKALEGRPSSLGPAGAPANRLLLRRVMPRIAGTPYARRGGRASGPRIHEATEGGDGRSSIARGSDVKLRVSAEPR